MFFFWQRLILKKKNDKTILHAYKEKNYLPKDATYQAKKKAKRRKEQRKIDSERGTRTPVSSKEAYSPNGPRYHVDLGEDDVPPPSKLRPIPDVAQIILGFGLQLTPKQRRRLQLDMARKPGEARPELQRQLDQVIEELTEREEKLEREMEDLLKKERAWTSETNKAGHDLDVRWNSITSENGYSAVPTEFQRLFQEEMPLTHAKEEREQCFGGIDYQAAQTLRLAKFVHGDKSDFARKLNNEIRKWDRERENLMGQILFRRSHRRNEPLLEPPVSHAAPLPSTTPSRSHRSTTASIHDRPPHLSSPHDSAVPTPDTPTTPSHRFLSLRHQRRHSFDSDSSFSSSDSESGSERSFDEEELLARNRYSRSKGGRRYAERW